MDHTSREKVKRHADMLGHITNRLEIRRPPRRLHLCDGFLWHIIELAHVKLAHM
jgi:hypothetical protein